MSDLIFGKYQIQSRLAIGGMGEVFFAVQKGVPGFERPAILKNLLPELASQDGFIEQFLDEARVAATLNHPNVVSIFEVGQWNGVYFIAMEYIHGRNLSQLLKASARQARPVPPAVTARIIHDAAIGLHHAHTAMDGAGTPLSIVHRDVSPQNIMVREDGVTKVVDFGIARAANRATRTATGTLKGKLAYMAPEQMQGGAVSSAVDQYALGVVFWEMTCGRRLFKSDQDLELMKAVIAGNVPLPSSLGANPELDAIVMRMLEKDSRRRFSSCEEVANALDHFLKGQSGSGRDSPVATYLKALGPPEGGLPRVTPSGPSKNFVISLGSNPAGQPPTVDPTRSFSVAIAEPPAAGRRRGAMVGLAVGALALALSITGYVVTRPAPLPIAEAPLVRPEPQVTTTVEIATPEAKAPKLAMLALKSTPLGASVRVDGRPVGTTPLELSLTMGEAHFLALEKPGFKRHEREVRVADSGERTELDVKLVKLNQTAPAPVAAAPEGPGFLTLSTEPWTKVSVGTALLGSTPLYKARLEAGKQTLTLVNEGKGINTTRTVVIKSGEVTRLDLKL